MKTNYDGKEFDSELEVEYYKYLKEGGKNGEVLDFIYHPSQIPNLLPKRSYTPDFIVWYDDRIEVIETKGWNQFTYRIDDEIHHTMLNKSEEWLREYVESNSNAVQKVLGNGSKVIYRKIKYLKSYGWVDYDFKNPNTIANQRKNKIQELEKELKQLKNELKDFNRYYKLSRKSKLTLAQKMFIIEFMKKKDEELGA